MGGDGRVASLLEAVPLSPVGCVQAVEVEVCQFYVRDALLQLRQSTLRSRVLELFAITALFSHHVLGT